MTRLARVVVPGSAHHVTQAGVRNLAIFASDDDRRRYLTLVAETSRRFGLQVLAYVLMDSYVRLVVVPETATALARALGEAHRRYTLAFNERAGARGFLFQGRFASCPLDEEHGLIAAVCVEREPVRAGAVVGACDYPWSSARFNAGLVPDDPLVGRRLAMPGGRPWRELLAQDPPRMLELLASSRTGRPCGCAEFLAHAEAATGRILRPHPAGRPRKRPAPELSERNT